TYSSIYYFLFFFLSIPPPPTSTLFPYTTLFRSFLHLFDEIVSAFLESHVACGCIHQRDGGQIMPGDMSSQVTAVSVPTCVTRCLDRKSTRLNSSHLGISYAVFCLKKKKKK